MTARQYERLSAPFRTPVRARALSVGNRVLTAGCYLLYPLALVLLWLRAPLDCLRGVLVPGIGFVILSIVRSRIGRLRPYEALDITPILHKNTHANSMPSRHVFSIFAIAMLWLWFVPAVGIALLVCGVLLACVRVIGGVHYPGDVIAGACAGVACGLVGLWLIP